MPFKFVRSESTLYDPEGRILDHDAYSGHGEGLNNPYWEAVTNAGPIPAGEWHIGPVCVEAHRVGPLAMPLTAMEGTDAQGHRALLIRGEGDGTDHTSGFGSIFTIRSAREIIAESADRVLAVE
jgi:hypothetical protein